MRWDHYSLSSGGGGRHQLSFNSLQCSRPCWIWSNAPCESYPDRQIFDKKKYYLHHGGGNAIRSVCLSFVLSASRITAKVISWFHWNLVLWLGLPIGRTGGDPVPDTDSGSLFHFLHHWFLTVTGWFWRHSATRLTPIT